MEGQMKTESKLFVYMWLKEEAHRENNVDYKSSFEKKRRESAKKAVRDDAHHWGLTLSGRSINGRMQTKEMFPFYESPLDNLDKIE